MNKLLTMVAITIVSVIIGTAAGISLSNAAKGSNVARAVQAEVAKREITRYTVQGCAMKGQSNPGFAIALAMSQGQVCLQVIGDLIEDTIQGKGICATADPKCLFEVAFAKTAVTLGADPKTQQEIDLLQEEANLQFDKINSMRENK